MQDDCDESACSDVSRLGDADDEETLRDQQHGTHVGEDLFRQCAQFLKVKPIMLSVATKMHKKYRKFDEAVQMYDEAEHGDRESNERNKPQGLCICV